jgi:hypothetical protein
VCGRAVHLFVAAGSIRIDLQEGFDAVAAPRERSEREQGALRSLQLCWASRSVVVIAGGRGQRHWPTASQLPVDTAPPRREQR